MERSQGEEVGRRIQAVACGDRRSNGMRIIVSEEISKQVVRVEIWEGRIVMRWLVMLRQMVCVMSFYWPETGRTGVEKQEFRVTLERMMGMVELDVTIYHHCRGFQRACGRSRTR